MGNKPFIIDRKPILKIFESMVCGNTNHYILRISGRAKMGKTHMLKEFRRQAIFDHSMKLGTVQLGEELTDAQSILFDLRNQLSDYKFDQYTQAINSQSVSKAEVQDTKLFWSNVSVNVEAQKDKDEKRRQFTLAFVEDLKANQTDKLLLCIDTVDEVEHLHGWLQHEFLSGVCRLENVYVVVAGRSLPKIPPSLEWHCEDLELGPVEYHHYEEYRKEAKLNITDEILEAFYKAFDGRPGNIVEVAPKFKGAT